MKNLLLPLILFAFQANAQTQPDYYNQSASGFDPVIGMTSNGESESMKASSEAMKKGQDAYKDLNGKFRKSQQSVENLEVVKFQTKNYNTPTVQNETFQQSPNSEAQNSDNEVDPFGSSSDSKQESWEGDKVDVDKYYNKTPDDSYEKKDAPKVEKSGSYFMLLLIGIFILLALVIFISISKSKVNKDPFRNGQFGVDNLRSHLVNAFEENFQQNKQNFGSHEASLSIIASASLHELRLLMKEKTSFLSTKYDVGQHKVSATIDECYNKVYNKYFEN